MAAEFGFAFIDSETHLVIPSTLSSPARIAVTKVAPMRLLALPCLILDAVANALVLILPSTHAKANSTR